MNPILSMYSKVKSLVEPPALPVPVYGEGTSIVIEAATALAPAAMPKPNLKAMTLPSYLTTTQTGSFALPKQDRRLATRETTTYRNGASTAQTLRDFAAASPDMSGAIFAYLRTAITGGYSGVAKNLDGSFNPDATNLLQQLMMRMDVLPNYADGYGGSYSIRSVAESMAKEMLIYGAMACELVLDKTRTPWRIQPIHTPHIEFLPDGNDLIPRQVVAGVTIPLDVPTFFYTALDQDLLTPYSSSPFESAIRPAIFSEDFVQDLWKVVKQAVHPRQHVKINLEKLQAQMPVEAAHDSKIRQEWLDGTLAAITDTINTLGPEEALIYYDFMEVERDNNGNSSLSSEWQTLQNIANSKLSTGAKTLPAILGHGVGSSNVASTESMLFVKSASGAVQVKLNETFSRVLTLAVRLYGLDVVVDFKFDPVDLRPESELESYKSMKQSRILEQLSLGLITDEDASLQLTGKLPLPGATKLSGTGFFNKKGAATNSGDENSSNDGSTLNKNLNSDAPSGGGRGSNTKNGNTKQ